MQLINATRMAAGFTLGRDSSGRESVVVVAKGTFTLPSDGDRSRLLPIQEPLVTADVFSGEPGFSAPIYESDFAPLKLRCDVLLNGSAHAPGGKPAQRVDVALRVATITKSFEVVGPRTWRQGLVGFAASEAEFLTVLPISYDNAFGGVDQSDPDKPRFYPSNHAGVGYHHNTSLDSVVGQPLPNTQEPENPVTNPRGVYRPMAFGAIGRSWDPRPQYAGTYDQRWIDDVFPFLPKDFRNEYFQCAPPDQQCDYLRGGEAVALVNLTPLGRCSFQLPTVVLPVEFTDIDSNRTRVDAVCDTLIIEPDQSRFMMVWRASLSLKRDIMAMRQAIVGTPPPGWKRARDTGKVYYPSLAALGE
ncbi:MAG TPA: DUF2169 domain-containing protein [candidate division Zixibacteria bacterium]|jgi:hypothetical protein